MTTRNLRESGNICRWKDGAHTVNQEMKGHTRLVMSFGHRAALSVLLKQKINTMSSTEIETVAISDGMPKNMWVSNFRRAQGQEVNNNLLNEDNTVQLVSPRMVND